MSIIALKMLHPFKCLISGFDGLQLAANQPGWKLSRQTPPYFGKEKGGRLGNWAAEKPSHGQGITASG